MYYKWKKLIHPSIQLYPVELPGRGVYMDMSLCHTLDDMLDHVYEIIKHEINSQPFAFFGHSMGSLIAYELTHFIWEKDGMLPQHLFVSGRRPPHLSVSENPCHHLPYNQFKERLANLNGTPAEILLNDEMFSFFELILRADFQISETYRYVKKKNKLSVPLTVFTGIEDEMSVEEMQEWEDYTEQACQVYSFDGGHFFLNDNVEELVGCISNKLLSQINFINAGIGGNKGEGI